mmetsp:Transcript_171018/g.415651  ORF Transcript_171018/g.415651 Transcript_171018/m.415651 type:complete len:182 (+) Transcript_171018:148-693(+)
MDGWARLSSYACGGGAGHSGQRGEAGGEPGGEGGKDGGGEGGGGLGRGTAAESTNIASFFRHSCTYSAAISELSSLPSMLLIEVRITRTFHSEPSEGNGLVEPSGEGCFSSAQKLRRRWMPAARWSKLHSDGLLERFRTEDLEERLDMTMPPSSESSRWNQEAVLTPSFRGSIPNPPWTAR